MSAGGARQLLTLAAIAIPPTLVCAWTIHAGTSPSTWMLLGGAAALSLALAFRAASRRAGHLRTITSVLAAYREGDFSIRARQRDGDALVEDALDELNQLGDILRSHRLGAMEAWNLLRKVMSEVDVVVLAVDDGGKIRLANEAASRALGTSSRDLLGKGVSELGLADLLEGTVPRIATVVAGASAISSGRAGSWELRRGSFRMSGEQQTLIVLSDVSRALRDNEREAWRRLIRVMGHEINNSLSPIRSISDSLLGVATKQPPDWEDDLKGGLAVIARRAESLSRFMASYATLARLPPPQRGPVDLPVLVRKIAALETRATVDVLGGPDITILGDADQLEQALINLVKNAAEATLMGSAAGAAVRIGWTLEESTVVLAIEDDGPGVSDTANLFVPFFTTKPNGSGIGLVLSRQIVEAHEGDLSVVTRPTGSGAIARIRLPRRVV